MEIRPDDENSLLVYKNYQKLDYLSFNHQYYTIMFKDEDLASGAIKSAFSWVGNCKDGDFVNMIIYDTELKEDVGMVKAIYHSPYTLPDEREVEKAVEISVKDSLKIIYYCESDVWYCYQYKVNPSFYNLIIALKDTEILRDYTSYDEEQEKDIEQKAQGGR